jgi:hypothetical protein
LIYRGLKIQENWIESGKPYRFNRSQKQVPTLLPKKPHIRHNLIIICLISLKQFLKPVKLLKSHKNQKNNMKMHNNFSSLYEYKSYAIKLYLFFSSLISLNYHKFFTHCNEFFLQFLSNLQNVKFRFLVRFFWWIIPVIYYVLKQNLLRMFYCLVICVVWTMGFWSPMWSCHA